MNIKKLISLAVCLCIMLQVTSCGFIRPIDDSPVATVNGQPISQEEFKFFLETMKVQMESEAQPENSESFWQTEIDGENVFDVAKTKALDSAVKNKVTVAKATEKGITLSTSEKQNVKNSYVSQLGGRENYLAALDEYNLSDVSFTQLLEDNYLSSLLRNKLIEEDPSLSVDSVTQQEIDAYIQEHKDDMNIKAQHILFNLHEDPNDPSSPLLPDEQVAEIQAKAEGVLARAKAGEDFTALMEEYGEDPGQSSQPDGYVFGKGQMVPEFEQAAYALEVDEISDLVKTDFGFHIIKRVELPPDDIKQNVADQKYLDMVDQWVKEATVEQNLDVLAGIKL